MRKITVNLSSDGWTYYHEPGWGDGFTMRYNGKVSEYWTQDYKGWRKHSFDIGMGLKNAPKIWGEMQIPNPNLPCEK